MSFILNKDSENVHKIVRSEAVVALQSLDRIVKNSSTGASELRDVINELEFLKANINSSMGISAIHGRQKLISGMDEDRILITRIDNAIDLGKNMLTSLPKKSEKKFNGNPVEWFRFLETFEKSIHNRSDYSDACKLRCMMNMVEGLPYETIKKLPLIDASYLKALELLKSTYNNKKVLIEAHLYALFDLKSPDANSESLSKFKYEYEYHIRALKTYENKFETSGFIISEMLKRKLPVEIQKRISKINPDNYWCLNTFLKALNYEINNLSGYNYDSSTLQDSQNNSINGQNIFSPLSDETPKEDLRMSLSRKVSNIEKRPSNTDTIFNKQRNTVTKFEKKRKKRGKSKKNKAFQEKTSEKKQKKVSPVKNNRKTLHCKFCQTGPTMEFGEYCQTCDTVKKRREKASELHMCLQCLAKSHETNLCRIKLKCIYCGGRHKICFCLRKENIKRNKRQKQKQNTNGS